jgi:hypothetical protein
VKNYQVLPVNRTGRKWKGLYKAVNLWGASPLSLFTYGKNKGGSHKLGREIKKEVKRLFQKRRGGESYQLGSLHLIPFSFLLAMVGSDDFIRIQVDEFGIAA